MNSAPVWPPRLTRRDSVEYVRQTYGIKISPNTFRSWGLPYIRIRWALYERADIDAYCAALLANAEVGRGAPVNPATRSDTGRYAAPEEDADNTGHST